MNRWQNLLSEPIERWLTSVCTCRGNHPDFDEMCVNCFQYLETKGLMVSSVMHIVNTFSWNNLSQSYSSCFFMPPASSDWTVCPVIIFWEVGYFSVSTICNGMKVCTLFLATFCTKSKSVKYLSYFGNCPSLFESYFLQVLFTTSLIRDTRPVV